MRSAAEQAAALCPGFFTSCGEMRPGSGFLNQLNAGDETLGGVKYTTLSSTCDEAVLSRTSPQLAGANNVSIGCVEHIVLPFANSVESATIDAIR